ncbi:MAG: 30S ribosomal protein S9 [Spirochaetia bacterium]|nr:30S ribosomal protein S9 [Spirochaetota bacterium]MCX8096645.1 30S ribosomal protein S9 [Spirochaetota bacterium]MDW8112092.1 30S ribosomal protein S9 [Spirochaetia bacterium]
MAKTVIARGGRKTATARVFLSPGGKGNITVNGLLLKDYFKNIQEYIDTVLEPFRVTNTEGKFDVYVTVKGGGISSQAQAIRHGISLALAKYDTQTLRPNLRRLNLVRRDPRAVERKKYGKVKARKSKQYSKR